MLLLWSRRLCVSATVGVCWGVGWRVAGLVVVAARCGWLCFLSGEGLAYVLLLRKESAGTSVDRCRIGRGRVCVGCLSENDGFVTAGGWHGEADGGGQEDRRVGGLDGRSWQGVGGEHFKGRASRLLLGRRWVLEVWGGF